MSTNVNNQHPEYAENLPLWTKSYASMKTVRIFKAKTTYLKRTGGQEEHKKTEGNDKPYEAYIDRANFPLIFPRFINSLTGVMNSKVSAITVPSRMLSMLDTITSDKRSVDQLKVQCDRAVLSYGRGGLLVDPDAKGEASISLYSATSIINWAETVIEGRRVLSLVVLKVDAKKDDTDLFSHETKEQFKVLKLVDGVYTVETYEDNKLKGEAVTPFTAGKKTLNYIPFTFFGAVDSSPEVDEPPLQEVVEMAHRIYRNDADYQQTLHMTAEATPYTTGASEGGGNIDEDGQITNDLPNTIGSTTIWHLPAEATCGFLEIKGEGINKIKECIEAAFALAQKVGGELTSSGSGVESAEAIKTRMNSRQANLWTIALSVSDAIEFTLRACAEFMAISGTVEFKGNMEFTSQEINYQLINALVAAINSELIPKEVLQNYIKEAGLTEKDTEELDKLIETGIPLPPNTE